MEPHPTPSAPSEVVSHDAPALAQPSGTAWATWEIACSNPLGSVLASKLPLELRDTLSERTEFFGRRNGRRH
jgi:hypothetical protein